MTEKADTKSPRFSRVDPVRTLPCDVDGPRTHAHFDRLAHHNRDHHEGEELSCGRVAARAISARPWSGAALGLKNGPIPAPDHGQKEPTKEPIT